MTKPAIPAAEHAKARMREIFRCSNEPIAPIPCRTHACARTG